MSGEVMVGTCDVCGKQHVPLNRKTYYYGIKCECHSPEHFEVVYYCSDCQPEEPKETRIILKTADIKNGNFKMKYK